MTSGPVVCGEFTAVLLDRCTGAVRATVDSRGTSLTFGRAFDRTSIATLTWRGAAAACCPVDVCEPIEWGTELAIFQNPGAGRASEPVWIGPVVGVFAEPNTPDVVVRAFDRSVWWFGQDAGERTVTGLSLQPGEITDTGGDLWRRVYDEANVLDPDGLTVHYYDRGATAGFTLDVAVGDPIRDLLSDLSDLGTHWTVAGRRLHVGRDTAPHGGVLRGGDWRDNGFPTETDGFGVVNYATVRNRDRTISASSPQSVSDATIENRCRYGLHMRTFDVDVATIADAQMVADQIIEEHSTPTMIASTGDGTLDPDTALQLCDAIPGRWFRVVTEPGACVPVSRDQRLTEVEVSAADGVGTGFRIVTSTAPPDIDERAA